MYFTVSTHELLAVQPKTNGRMMYFSRYYTLSFWNILLPSKNGLYILFICYLSISLSVYLSVYQSIYQSVYNFKSISVFFGSIYLFFLSFSIKCRIPTDPGLVCLFIDWTEAFTFPLPLTLPVSLKMQSPFDSVVLCAARFLCTLMFSMWDLRLPLCSGILWLPEHQLKRRNVTWLWTYMFSVKKKPRGYPDRAYWLMGLVL